jgi:hypothetical protein
MTVAPGQFAVLLDLFRQLEAVGCRHHRIEQDKRERISFLRAQQHFFESRRSRNSPRSDSSAS